AVPGLRPNRIPLVYGLAVEREIETLALDLVGDAQPDEDVDDLENDQRHDGVVAEHDEDAVELVEHLHRIAIEQAGLAAICLDRKHAGEQRAHDAANSVHAEGVERVVVAQHVLQAGAAPVADDASGSADADRADRTDEDGSRGNRHETGYCARADADHRRLAAYQPLNDHPREGRYRGRHVRHQHGHAGQHAGAHRRAGVEAEPADPQQRGADEGQDHVMSRAGFLAFSQYDAGHQPGNAGIDVHDRAASEVQDLDQAVRIGGVEEPVRTPDPVGNRRIDENRPKTDEPQHG